MRRTFLLVLLSLLALAPAAFGQANGSLQTHFMDIGQGDIFDQTGRGASATEPLARDVRLVFTAGTPPEAELRRIRDDGRMRLAGFARISLTPVSEAIVSRRAVEGKFPYEIVVTSLGNGR
jgi:hypothetical protein